MPHRPDGDEVLRAESGRIVAVLDLLLVCVEDLRRHCEPARALQRRGSIAKPGWIYVDDVDGKFLQESRGTKAKACVSGPRFVVGGF